MKFRRPEEVVELRLPRCFLHPKNAPCWNRFSGPHPRVSGRVELGKTLRLCQQVLSGCWSRQASENHWWSELTLAVGMAVPRVTEWSKRTHRSVLSCCLQAEPQTLTSVREVSRRDHVRGQVVGGLWEGRMEERKVRFLPSISSGLPWFILPGSMLSDESLGMCLFDTGHENLIVKWPLR